MAGYGILVAKEGMAMKDVNITVLRRTEYPDLMERYELPQEVPCEMVLGQVFVSKDAVCPDGFCHNAWETLAPFVKTLAEGGGGFYGEWMKNPHSALLSCNDGFRPVSFLIETVE